MIRNPNSDLAVEKYPDDPYAQRSLRQEISPTKELQSARIG
jgi:hypothetical protein